MRKSTKLIKRFLALFLVVLMSIESFAAVVSDSDGSAFVAKKEFEALKSEFADQINNYNTSIDNKIDGKIAEYLKGRPVQYKKIKSLLDENGEYGGYKEYWSSNTSDASGAYDRRANKYARNYYRFDHYESSYGIGISLDNPIRSSWSTDEKVRDYYSSKNVDFYLDDGTKVTGLQRMLIKCDFYHTHLEGKNYYRNSTATDYIRNTNYKWVPGSMWSEISSAASSVNQTTKNKIIISAGDATTWALSPVINYTYSSIALTITHSPAYMGMGVVSVYTDEVSYDYVKESTVYPLSDRDDLYWKADDTTSTLVTDGSVTATDDIYDTPLLKSTYRGQWFSDRKIDWDTITPSVALRVKAPWMATTGIKAKEEYLYHWNQASTKNRKVKNGMYIGQTTSFCTLQINAKSDKAGKLYVWTGNAGKVIDNWTSSDFEGEVFDLEANKEKKCELEEVGKNKNIFIIFLPTSNTDKALLKISSMYEIA